ncbi:MAG: tetratricopeptide repeat protein [Pseudomonadota bacterium]
MAAGFAIPDTPTRYRVGTFKVDTETNKVTDPSGTEHHVRPQSIAVLSCLLDAAPRLQSANEIINTLWPRQQIDDSVIHRRISELRKLFGDSSRSSSYIETVPRKGYRIIATVSEDAPREPARKRSVAVLRFDVFEDDAALRSVADAMCEEITDYLASNTIVDVASRTVAFQVSEQLARGDPGLRDATEITERLQVGYLIEGSLRRHGDGLRVTIQLIRGRDGYHIWSRASDHPAEDQSWLTTFTRGVAHHVFSDIDFDRYQANANILPEFQGIAPKAVRHYLRAENQYRLAYLGENHSWEVFYRSLNKAIELDPGFAMAYFALANAYMDRRGGVSHAQAIREAHKAIDAGMQLESDSPDCLQQLAQIQINLDLDYRSAAASFRRCLDKNPIAKWCYIGLARIALKEGRLTEIPELIAAASQSNVVEEETGFIRVSARLMHGYGDYDRAMALNTQGLDMVFDGEERLTLLTHRADMLLETGQLDAARTVIEDVTSSDPHRLERYAGLLARIGDTDRATSILEHVTAPTDEELSLAQAFVVLGDFDQAIQRLDYGVEDRQHNVIDSLRGSSHWDPLRGDPRFDALIDRVREMEVWTNTPTLQEALPHNVRPLFARD